MIENLREINLENTPYLKELLENYIKIKYEDEADLSQESLIRELIELDNTNELNQLFFAEHLSNNS